MSKKIIYQFKHEEIKHCYECPVCFSNHCSITRKVIDYMNDDAKIPEWCPLEVVLK